VVFVIDVSGSMGSGGSDSLFGGGSGNDPRQGDTCGRLQAIEAVIAAIPQGAALYSIITFSSGVQSASSASFPTQDALFADLAGDPTKIADIVCAAGGDTNYQAALTKAGQLLSAGRPDATKEIYFVSDGQPTQGEDGIAEAAALKTNGVAVGTEDITATIATVMLNGTDQVMEKYICSKDPSGNPLHAYVNGSGSLTSALTKLAANGIASGDVKYRAAGSTQYTTLNLMQNLQGFVFTLPSITISKEQAAAGVEVLFEYADQHDNEYSTGGKLLWTEQGGGAGGN
jgi:hypothetical protein